MYSLWKQLLNVCVICKLNYYSVPSKPVKFSSSAAYSIVVMILSVADLGGVGPPLFWVKKEEMTEGKMANRASKSRPVPPPHPPSAQGLDPPLFIVCTCR